MQINCYIVSMHSCIYRCTIFLYELNKLSDYELKMLVQGYSLRVLSQLTTQLCSYIYNLIQLHTCFQDTFYLYSSFQECIRFISLDASDLLYPWIHQQLATYIVNYCVMLQYSSCMSMLEYNSCSYFIANWSNEPNIMITLYSCIQSEMF